MPGLPNDHYHAFLDPIVVILIAAPAARLFEQALAAWRSTRRPGPAIAGIAIGAGLALLVTVALVRKPAQLDPDGGWPAMRAAGERIAQVAGGRPINVVGLPKFKLPDAVSYPVVSAGGRMVGDLPTNLDVIVVACDRLFEAAIGMPCGGPAEDHLLGIGMGGRDDLRLLDRFDASARTSISIYGPAAGP